MRIKTIITAILIALILFIGFTFTPQFRSLLLNIAVSRAANYLEADLSVGKLTGSLVSSLKLHDITLAVKDSQLLHIDSISMRYSLRYLLRKEINIEHIILDNLSLNAEYSDGEWNLLQIIKQQDEPEPVPEEEKPFTWKINLAAFKLQGAEIMITTANPPGGNSQYFDYLPSSISDLDLEFDLQYSENDGRFELKTFKCLFDWPDKGEINLNRLNFTLIQDEDEIYTQDFVLQTDNTKIDLFSHFKTGADLEHRTTLDIGFGNLQDVAMFAPQVVADESLSLSLALLGDNEILTLEKRIFVDGSLLEDFRIIFKAYMEDVSGFLSGLSDLELNSYEMSAYFDDFSPLRFVETIDDELKLNGIVLVNGDAMDIEKGNVRLVVSISEMLYSKIVGSDDYNGTGYDKYSLEGFRFEANLNDGALAAKTMLREARKTTLQLNFNTASLSALLNSIAEADEFRGLADYSLDFATENFDLGRITNKEEHSTNLNLRANIRGSDYKTDAGLHLKKSQAAGLTIDSINMAAFIDPEVIVLDTVNVTVDKTSLGLKGSLIDREVTLNYYLAFSEIDKIMSSFIEISEPITVDGILSGNLHGTADSLNISGSLQVDESLLGNITSSKIESDFLVLSEPHRLQANLGLDAQQILIDEFEIQRAGVRTEIDLLLADNDTDIFRELLAALVLDVELDEDHSITAEIDISGRESSFDIVLGLLAKSNDIIWQTETRKPRINFVPGKLVEVDSFRLYSNNQSIELDGLYSLNGSRENDLSFTIANLDLAELLILLNNDLPVEGIFDLAVNISGCSQEPVIGLSSNLSNIGYQDLKDMNVFTKIDYPGRYSEDFDHLPEYEVIAAVSSIELMDELLVGIDLYIPLKIGFGSGVEFYSDADSYLHLQTVPLNLSRFDSLLEAVDDLTGSLAVSLEVRDKLTEYLDIPADMKKELHLPESDESTRTFTHLSLAIENAGLRVHDLGTRYRDINFDVQIENDLLEIKRGEIRSGEGIIRMNGGFPLADPNQPLSFTFRANSFPAIANEALDVLINSNLSLSGSLSEPRFSGNVSIPRGRIYLNELLQEGAAGAGEVPLLAEAKKKQVLEEKVEPDIEEIQLSIPEPQTDIDIINDAINNSRGTINISFPRNVWVRSPETNIELRADLQIVKRDAHFEVFGSVNTIRGFYIFYGRRFQIVSGEVSFTGGRDINPQIALTLEYTFRGIDRGRNTLKLIVLGTMEELDITFELNNNPIEEADAISYIVFGRSFEELTRGEKAEATSQAVVLGNILANQLAGVVTDVVGETLGLDMIEFRSDTASSQVGVEIGKYLTERLFVSLKRDFNLTSSGESVAEEIVVEYEIRPYLFLQGKRGDDRDSGLDLIWRLSWE